VLKLAGKACASGPWAVVAEVGGEVEGAGVEGAGAGAGAGSGRWGMAVGRAVKPIAGAEGPASARMAERFGCMGAGRAGAGRGARASACGRPVGVAVPLWGAVPLWVGGERLVGEGAREGCALGWVGLRPPCWWRGCGCGRVWDGLGGAGGEGRRLRLAGECC